MHCTTKQCNTRREMTYNAMPRKNNKLENVAIENALQLEAARAMPAFAALTTMPCQV